MSETPDRYVIKAKIAKDALTHKAGDPIALYWSPEGGGWWQWGPEGWAYRFESMEDPKLADAMQSAPKVGPWFNYPDPTSIEVVAVPALVEVRVY